MGKIFRGSTIGIFAGVFISCLFGMALAQETFYKYVDKNGTVHFTDRLESIPAEYRNQVKVRKQEVQTPSAPQGKSEKGQELKGPRAGEKLEVSASGAEKEKGSEEAKPPQEKAQREKGEKERIQKARQEKMKEIAELRKQVEAKDKEASSLRTNWMVYDRIKLNQLNEEKEKLQKEIQTLQEELAKIK
jgi:chromosome segregation ATPase